MFIQTEETPNPATMKFLPGRDVMGTGTLEITSAEAAAASPLAQALFGLLERLASLLQIAGAQRGLGQLRHGPA